MPPPSTYLHRVGAVTESGRGRRRRAVTGWAETAAMGAIDPAPARTGNGAARRPSTIEPVGTTDGDPGTPLRVAVVAPPWLELPPDAYGGVESVCSDLVDAL